MEQRQESRFTLGEVIRITLLDPAGEVVEGRVTDVSPRGLGVELPRAVNPGTAVRINLADAFVLGEAIHASPRGDSYYCGLHLDQALTGLAQLARIVQAFEEDLEPQAVNSARERRHQN